MSDLPAPLTPPDCDCTDLDGFMLNVERLMASELVALSTHEIVAAAMFVWCRAWKQRPAASLPDDDRVNAAFARLPLAKFRRFKEEILRGFVKCSDGRLYHRTLAAEAVRAFERKTAFHRKRETDNQRLKKWRANKGETPSETHDETTSETQNETRFVAEGQGRDRDVTVRKKSSLRSDSAGDDSKNPVVGKSPTPSQPSLPIEAKEPAKQPAARKKAAGLAPKEPPGFAEFFAAFPRRVDRGDARKAFEKALEKAPAAVLVAGAKAYAEIRSSEDPRYTKHPATWLNKESWTDDEIVSRATSAPKLHGASTPSPLAKRPDESDDYYRCRVFKERGFWLAVWGANPTDPVACSINKTVLAEFGYAAQKEHA